MSTRKRTRTLLIVTAAQREAANAVAVQVAGPYAADTFSVPYTSGVGTKATHYAACWRMTNKQLGEFKQRMAAKMASKAVQVMEQAGREKLVEQKFAPVKESIEQRVER